MSDDSRSTPPGETVFALPLGSMLGATVGIPGLTAAVWAIVTGAGDRGAAVVAAGVWGAAIVAAVGAGVLLLMRPRTPRPALAWTTIWLAGTAARLLLTPALGYLLYSATSLPATPLLLAVAVAYVLALFGEAALIALHVKRVT